jgi:predicted amidophosphoribosyltransferase
MRAGAGQIGRYWFTWILDNHWDFAGANRTAIGELVYDAKYKSDPSATRELMSIAQHSILQISNFAGIDGPSGLECVVAVPSSSRPGGDGNLPRLLSRAISQTLRIPDASNKVSIVSGLSPAKTGAVRTPGDFSVSAEFDFENVLLVDDLLSTGQTMTALGECLTSRKRSGRLCGFALTKVHKGLGN